MTARRTSEVIAEALTRHDSNERPVRRVDANVAHLRLLLSQALPGHEKAVRERLADRARVHNGNLEVAVLHGWHPISAEWALSQAIELSSHGPEDDAFEEGDA